ncbi:MAG: hypothetical protein PHT60_13410 [Acidiphilium sp.]|nr:hypothetical protein [Acidiphilium sp.]MDD4936760.1 hypothetical protein [Acidiphilium sp.]
MTEPETEIDTLDRLEAALGRIAAHAAAPTRPHIARTDIAAALDRVIKQLRDALAASGPAEAE